MSAPRKRIRDLRRHLVTNSTDPTPLERWHSVLRFQAGPRALPEVLRPHVPALQEGLLIKSARIAADRAQGRSIIITALCVDSPEQLAEAVSYPPDEPLPDLLLEYRRKRTQYRPEFWKQSKYPPGHLLSYGSFYSKWCLGQFVNLISPDPEALDLRRRCHDLAMCDVHGLVEPEDLDLGDLPDGLFRVLNIPMPRSHP